MEVPKVASRIERRSRTTGDRPTREGPGATKNGRKQKLAAAAICIVVITITPGGESEGQRSKTSKTGDARAEEHISRCENL